MRVAFRVDAGADIGIGHVMRCRRLALALLKIGVSCVFLMRRITPEVLSMLEEDGIKAVVDPGPQEERSEQSDAAWSASVIGDAHYDWIVVDHYELGAKWEAEVGVAGRKVMVIDDLANRSHVCSILVDVNAYADLVSRYDGLVPAACTVLLGPRYALIDEVFASLHTRSMVRTGSVDRVLVGFGGADQDDYTGRVVEALAALASRPAYIDVIVGSAYPYQERLSGRCLELGFSLHVQVKDKDVAALMGSADLAIGGGGSMTWERCCVGVPTLAFAIAPNQRRVVLDGAARGFLCAPDMGQDLVGLVTRHVQCLMENPQLRTMMSTAALSVVDGCGVSRVVRAMCAPPVSVRLAEPEDAEFLYQCRNHPVVRAVSRVTAEVPWETHHRWFSAARANRNRLILIGTNGDDRVGFVRFDITDKRAEVSIVVKPGQHGNGIGRAMLRAAERMAISLRPELETFSAVVLDGNRASTDLFESAGYALAHRTYSKPSERVVA